MHEFIAKITRAAASKMAAFGYAVAVGVAGNLAFHFVQPHDPAPAALASPASSSASVAAPPGADLAPAVTPSAMALPPAAVPAAKPPPIKPVATVPILPITPATDLPGPAALPAPVLRPTALPASHPPVHANDTAALPEAPGPLTPVTPHVSFAPSPSTPLTSAPAPTALYGAAPYGASPPRTTAGIPLDPVGRPIDVAPVPNPPAAALPTTPPPTALLSPKPATSPTPDAAATAKPEPGKTDAGHSLELSDLWHPSRAVRKSLDWADQQLPSLGGSDTAAAVHPAAHAPAVTAPISLLPSSADGGLQGSDKAEPAKPVKPGPGSGGLY